MLAIILGQNMLQTCRKLRDINTLNNTYSEQEQIILLNRHTFSHVNLKGHTFSILETKIINNVKDCCLQEVLHCIQLYPLSYSTCITNTFYDGNFYLKF